MNLSKGRFLSRARRLVIQTLVFALLPITAIQVVIAPNVHAATTTSCGTAYSPNATEQGNIKITPVHGSIFYIDSGQNQTVDAEYIGYKVTASVATSNIWVKLDSFSGGYVSLSNPADSMQQVGSLAANGSSTVFFLLKASRSTTTAQAHTVHVYVGRPDLGSSTEKYSCNFSFIKVSETIKASANKVSSILSSTSTLISGQNLIVTVRGYSGTIGQGSPLDGTILWFSPASKSSWPTTSLRLVNTSVTLYSNKAFKNAVNNGVFTNQLYVKKLNDNTTAITSGSKYYYEGVYTFNILGPSASSTTVTPIAQISSGTQIKHTDLSSIPTTTLNTNSISSSVSVTKTASSTVSFSANIIEISYTIKLTNTSTTAVTVDQIWDDASPLLTFKASSAQTQANGSSLASYPDPYIDTSGRWIFGQPILVPAAASATSSNFTNLTYKMVSRTACSGTSGYSYNNSATGQVGTITLAASGTTISGVNTSGTCNVTTATVTSSDVSLIPEATTQPASSISISGSSASAVLNGTVNPHGNSGETTVFELSTDSTLSTGVSNQTPTSNATTGAGTTWYAISANATSLTANTTYYYRTKVSGTGANGVANTVYGDIMSFVTPVVSAPPTVTTNSASNVTTTSADMNATVNPNAVSGGTTIQFQYTAVAATDGTCPAAQVTTYTSVTVLDDAGATLTLTSSSPTDVLYSLSGLTSATYYCYRVVATYNTSSTVSGSWVAFRASAMTAQTISYPTPNQMSTNSTQNTTATATSGLAITYTSNTPSICTVSSTGVVTSVSSGSGGICSITASQPGDLTYSAATPVTVNFPVVGTVTLSYDLNTGSGTTPSSQLVSIGGSTTVAAGTGLTLNNFSFAGWNTSSAGTGTAYSAGSSITISADTVLFAQWNATITYNANGGTGTVNSQTALAGAISLQSSSGFTYSGFAFVGWNTSSDGTGAQYSANATYNLQGNVTLYAIWVNSSKYRVTYFGMGNTGGTVPAFADVSSPFSYTVSSSVPTKTGFTFAGWNTASDYSGTPRAAGATFTLTGSTNLYAVWQGTITYNGNGNTGGTVPSTVTGQNEGSNFTTSSSVPTKTNYDFAGWNSAADGTGDNYAVNTSYIFTKTMTLYAKWNPVALTITFDNNINPGATSTQTFYYNVAANLNPNSFTNGTSIFSGWATASNGSVVYSDMASATFTSSQTLYAKWVTSYAVTYNAKTSANGNISTGTAPTDINSPYSSGSTVTVMDNTGGLTVANYSFVGWCTTNNAANLTACTGTQYSANATFTMPSATVDLYAVFTPTYSVTYNGNTSGSGSVPTDGSSPYSSGSTVTVLGNIGSLAKTSYVFNGWCTTQPSAGATCSSVSGTSRAVGSTFTISGNTTLYAVWSTATYTVTYNGNTNDSGSVPTDASSPYNSGSTVTVKTNSGNLSLTGYDFDGWCTTQPSAGATCSSVSGTSRAASSTFSISSNTTLYAVWKIKTHTVTYSGNGNTGGSVPTDASSPYNYNSTVTIKTNSGSLALSGYIFDGWCTTQPSAGATCSSVSGTSRAVSSTFNIISDVNLYAVWSTAFAVNIATVTGGSGSSTSSSVTSGGSTNISATATSGYTFTSWSCTNGSVGNASSASTTLSNITANTTCTPTFTGNKYVYNANTATGSAPSDQQYAGITLTGAANTFTPPTSYEFGGWCLTQPAVGSNCSGTTYATSSNLPTPNSSTVNLFAIWTLVHSAGISNPANGGTGSTSASTVNHGGSVNLTASPAAGYSFSSWSCTVGSIGSASSASTTLSNITANTSCTPSFTANTLTVSYDSQGGSSISSTSTTTGGSVTDPGTPTQTGYTFNGWFENSTGGSSLSFASAWSHGRTSSFTLYAQWTINSYNSLISNPANGGTGSTSASTVNHGGSVNLTASPAAGYSFSSWSCTVGSIGSASSASTTLSNITANTSCTPSFTANTLTVSYDSQGGSSISSTSTTTGGSVTDPGTPTQTGYTFNGWFENSTGGSSLSFASAWSHGRTSSFTLYAQWTIKTYTVTYHSDGAENSGTITLPSDTHVYDHGSLVTVMDSVTALTKLNYTFGGWNTLSNGHGTDRNPNTTFNITGNTDLYPHWVPIGSKTVTFHINYGSNSDISTQNNTTEVDLDSNPFSISGYQFMGWASAPGNGKTVAYAQNAKYGFANNLDLYAIWNQIFTVSYNINGATSGSTPSSQSCVELDSCTSPITLNNGSGLSKAHHTFNGWTTTCDSGTGQSGSYSVTASLTLCARWIEDSKFTVTYNVNNGTSSAPTDSSNYYTSDEVTVSSNSATRNGFTFGGWNENDSGTGTNYAASGSAKFNMGNANVVLYAKWTRNKYKLTFDLDGGSATGTLESDVDFESNGYPNAPTSPNRTGHTFAGWGTTRSSSSSIVSTYSMPANAATLYAIWTINNYKITYNTNGGSFSDSTTSKDSNIDYDLDALSNTYAPADPTNSGKSFLGWNTNQNATTALSLYRVETTAKTLYAIWSNNPVYKVTFYINDDVNSTTEEQTGNVNSALRDNTFTRTGYTFAGWAETNSGSVSLANKANYGFGANKNLYAKWNKNKYSITYNLNGGSGTAPTESDQDYDLTYSVKSGSGLSRSGYTFAGWARTPGGSVISSFNIPANATNLYAIWNAVVNNDPTPGPEPEPNNNNGTKTLQIQYNGNGKSAGNEPSSVTVNTGETVKVSENTGELKKTGYVLKEWNTAPDGSGKTYKADGTDLVSVGGNSVTLYAIWDPKKITITYVNNDGSNTKKTETIVYDGPAATLPSAEKYGYDFKGWANDPQGNTDAGNAGESIKPANDITIYGKWEEKPLRDVVPKKSDPAVVQAPAVVTPAVVPAQPIAQPAQPVTTQQPMVSERWIETTVVKEIAVYPSVEKNTGFEISGNGWSIAITSTTKLVQAKSPEASNRVGIEAGNTVTSFGSGFKPNSQIDIYVYSEPIWLGSVIADANGNYKVTLPMPAELELGDHTFQAKGVTYDDKQRTANVPITLLPATIVAVPKQTLKFDVFFTMNSYFLDAAPRADIKKKLAYVKAHITKNSKITVSIVGWVQPTRVSPNVMQLSKGRAGAVEKYLKQLGLKAKYIITAPGHEKKNVASSRRASIIITWTNPK